MPLSLILEQADSTIYITECRKIFDFPNSLSTASSTNVEDKLRDCILLKQ